MRCNSLRTATAEIEAKGRQQINNTDTLVNQAVKTPKGKAHMTEVNNIHRAMSA